jgi:hypothetical protein
MVILATLEIFHDRINTRIKTFLASKWVPPAGSRFPDCLETGITLNGRFT